MSDRQLTEQRDLVRSRNRDARLSAMAEAQRLADQRRATAQRRAARDDADEM
jgi:hypothetical protein